MQEIGQERSWLICSIHATHHLDVFFVFCISVSHTDII